MGRVLLSRPTRDAGAVDAKLLYSPPAKAVNYARPPSQRVSKRQATAIHQMTADVDRVQFADLFFRFSAVGRLVPGCGGAWGSVVPTVVGVLGRIWSSFISITSDGLSDGGCFSQYALRQFGVLGHRYTFAS